MILLYDLYTKFTDHYPDYYFGYADKELYIKLSVQNKHTNQTRLEPMAKDATEDEFKLQWYKMMKELGYVHKTS